MGSNTKASAQRATNTLDALGGISLSQQGEAFYDRFYRNLAPLSSPCAQAAANKFAGSCKLGGGAPMSGKRLPPLPASNLLIDDQPILLLPRLAVAIGVNEAIALQQLRFLLGRSENVRDGRRWVYNTHEEWQQQVFPFWSVPTIRRVFAALEQAGLVVTATHYNHAPTDRTKWYTIDFAALEARIAQETKSADAPDQNDQMEPIIPIAPSDQPDPLLPETTSETTQKEVTSPVRASANGDASADAPLPPDEAVRKAVAQQYTIPDLTTRRWRKLLDYGITEKELEQRVVARLRQGMPLNLYNSVEADLALARNRRRNT